MIFINKKDLHFNIPSLLFRCEQTYQSFSYIGNFVNSEGYIGPSGCNGLAFNKINSIILSFSESIERRALMIGGKVKKGDQVETWDLVNQRFSSLPQKYTKYRIAHPYYIDTTGTASHYCSRIAIINAIKELIEKNALFLFWYGKKGFFISSNKYYKNPIFNKIKQENYNVSLYLNTDFYPIKVVITIIHKDGIIVSSGVGSSFLLSESISRSLSEAYLLKWQQIRNKIINRNYYSKDYREYHYTCLQYLNSINSEYTLDDNLDNPNYDNIDELKIIMSALPPWVTDLHIIPLTSLYEKLKCVKVFSSDLNNHIPLKNRIDLNQKINKMTINLNYEELKNLPECIII